MFYLQNGTTVYLCSSKIGRSSHLEVFQEKDVLKICSKFTGEHLCQSLISIKLQSNFIEITLRHGCSPVNLLHIFRTPFTKNTSGRLLLDGLNLKNFAFLIKLIFAQWLISIPFLYLLKLSENLSVSEGLKMKHWTKIKWIKLFFCLINMPLNWYFSWLVHFKFQNDSIQLQIQI